MRIRRIVGAAGLLIWFASAAYAQLALPGAGCQCVSDPPVEGNTSVIAASVTTPGGAGIWQSAATYLDQLSAAGGAHVTQPMQADFPSADLLPPDTVPLVKQIVGDSLNTYYNAWNVADELQANMDADDGALASIELNQSLGIWNPSLRCPSTADSYPCHWGSAVWS